MANIIYDQGALQRAKAAGDHEWDTSDDVMKVLLIVAGDAPTSTASREATTMAGVSYTECVGTGYPLGGVAILNSSRAVVSEGSGAFTIRYKGDEVVFVNVQGGSIAVACIVYYDKTGSQAGGIPIAFYNDSTQFPVTFVAANIKIKWESPSGTLGTVFKINY